MGRRGPKTQPTALKLSRGNPGHRPLNDAEPELEPAVADPPGDLKGHARREWERLAPGLVGAGVLTVGDLAVFRTYCELVELKGQYQKLVRRVGAATADRLGYTSRLLKLQAALKQHAAELGLTPSSRSGVKAVKRPEAKNTKRSRFFGHPGADQTAQG